MEDSDPLTWRQVVFAVAVGLFVAWALGGGLFGQLTPPIDDEQPVSPILIDAPWMH